jgi:hypothetical protein
LFGKNWRVSLETINSVAQIVAALGVVASLFYLAVQIRQNTKSQRSVVVDSLTNSLIVLLAPQAEPTVMRGFAAAVEDWDGAKEEDRMRAIAMLFTTFKLFENAWFQYRHGTLDRDQWEGWDRHIRVYYHRPGVQAWWTDRRVMFAPGFRTYVEATEPITGVSPLSQLIRGKS